MRAVGGRARGPGQEASLQPTFILTPPLPPRIFTLVLGDNSCRPHSSNSRAFLLPVSFLLKKRASWESLGVREVEEDTRAVFAAPSHHL